MPKDRPPTQSEMEFVSIDELIPQAQLLRKIEARVDCSFIHPLAKEGYSYNNGRLALEPTRMFKLLFLGYLLDVRSERRLIRNVQINVVYNGQLREQMVRSEFTAD